MARSEPDSPDQKERQPTPFGMPSACRAASSGSTKPASCLVSQRCTVPGGGGWAGFVVTSSLGCHWKRVGGPKILLSACPPPSTEWRYVEDVEGFPYSHACGHHLKGMVDRGGGVKRNCTRFQEVTSNLAAPQSPSEVPTRSPPATGWTPSPPCILGPETAAGAPT